MEGPKTFQETIVILLSEKNKVILYVTNPSHIMYGQIHNKCDYKCVYIILSIL